MTNWLYPWLYTLMKYLYVSAMFALLKCIFECNFNPCVVHQASQPAHQKRSKKSDIWFLLSVCPEPPHIISADILLTPLRRSICSVVCDNVWNPVGHRDMVLIGVTPWHFQPIRSQRWSLPTNQMPPLTICPGHPRCLGSHGECGSLSRLVTFGVMFLLDIENEFTWHCIGNWDCLHLISRPN